MPRKFWSHEELILALNLYCKTPFGRIHIHNPEIVSLAKLIGRTPSSVSWKLANFARLDPLIQARRLKGATHGAQGEIEVLDEFSSDWDKLAFESERLFARLSGRSLVPQDEEYNIGALREGREREGRVRIRVNQDFFRRSVLAAYDIKCCITGISISKLLLASHISPWRVDVSNRVNPRNGLCLNALHDKAFDKGLITITLDHKVVVSGSIKTSGLNNATRSFLLNYDGRFMRLPKRFLPDPDLLKYHNERIFIDALGEEAANT
ncbi:MAG TPA: HNH endonuclease [Candidatus Kryptobacter bacterium]|nr:HNH endonuclease [Candidatus Kryptobacter bacterium]